MRTSRGRQWSAARSHAHPTDARTTDHRDDDQAAPHTGSASTALQHDVLAAAAQTSDDAEGTDPFGEGRRIVASPPRRTRPSTPRGLRRLLRRTTPTDLPAPRGGDGPDRAGLDRAGRDRTGVDRTSAPLPADPQVEAILADIAELRLSAATHLTLAAAAMDAGRPEIASDLIEAQQRDVAHLRSRAEELLGVSGPTADEARRTVLHEAAAEETVLLGSATVPGTRRIRRDPARAAAAPLPRRRPTGRSAPRWSATGALLAAAAAAAVALVQPLAPPAPNAPTAQPSTATVSLDVEVSRSFAGLADAAMPPTRRADVEAARDRLHDQLKRLVPVAAQNAISAQHLLDVLRQERSLLAERAPSALPEFERQAAQLVTDLRAQATDAIRAMLPAPSAFGSTTTSATDALPSTPGPAKRATGNRTTTTGSADAAAATSRGSTAGTASSGSTGSSSAGAAGAAPVAPAPAPVLTVPALPIEPPPVVPDPLPQPSSDPAPADTGSGTADAPGPAADLSGLAIPQLPTPPVLDLPTG